MAETRYANVTFKSQHAGILREDPAGGTSFDYAEGFSSDIACSLPASQRTHRVRFGLIPFFAHLAPEGWLRARQSEFAEVDRADDFGILLSFGADCIGAVGVEDPTDSAAKVELHHGDALQKAGIALERTISGVQAKILCVQKGAKYRPAAETGPAPLIAKYASEDLPDMVANEEITLELCRILFGRDEVVTATRGFVEGVQRPALIVERFDRTGKTKEEKLRCEDFAQVIAQPPGRDLRGKYEAGYDAVARALSHSAAPLIDAQKVFERLVGFVLVGNVDCHLKNWSLLETPEGLRLSPVYDALNAYIYGAEGYSTRFGLLIDGERQQWEQYDRALLLRIAAELGLAERAATATLTRLKRREAAFRARLNQPLGLSEERTWAYRQSVEQAWNRIYG
ncbi:MAG: type II toxin-antitoxin system HipA family toxin [Kiloniellaceae bacterium]